MRDLFVRVCAGVLLAAYALYGGQYTAAQPGERVAEDELIIRLAPGVPESILSSLVPGMRADRIHPATQHFRLQLPPGLANVLARKLADDPRIEMVEPNRLREALGVPDDPGYKSEWALPMVNATTAWSLAAGRFATAASPIPNRPLIAVVDTGVDCTHPDFANAGGTSTDSASGGQLAFAKSNAYVTTTVSPAACPWQDDYGHGTHVAGTIAAAASNGIGATGLAYTAAIAAFKTSNSSGMSSDYAISQAIMAAADRGAKVISISLGGPGYSQVLEDAIKYAWQHDALVVAAAGNSNSNVVSYPGDASHAMTVAAVDTQKAKASYSNWGNFIGIAAPGSSIYSTAPTYPVTMNLANSYASLSGTSMATPHVSAVAGLLATAYPDASARAIATRLQQAASSNNTGGGWDQYLGYGVLDAGAALSGTLRPASVGSITGQIVDANKVAMAGALVSVAGAAYTTDSSGLYRLANLPAGPQQVTVSASGYPAMTFAVTVPQGADVHVPIKLGTTLGSYTGYVSSGGAPLGGAVVEALSGGLIQASVITAADGSYTVPVVNGTYTLRASALGYIATTSASVAAGTASPASVNFALSRLGTITGTVTNASGGGVGSAQLLFSNATFSGGALTDANGQFTSLGLPAGTYTVTASATGFDNVTVTGVVVAKDATVRTALQFALGVSSVTIGSSTVTGPVAIANNTVALNAPAPVGGAVVNLSSSSASATVPSSVTIPAGATSATFSVTTVSVPQSTPVVITAAFKGSSRTATTTILPPVMSKVTVATTAFAPGSTVTATAYINAAAPDSGATVTLSATPATAATVPATVVIPAGKTSATYTVTVSPTAGAGVITLSGTFGGVTKTAPLNVGTLALSSMAASPTSLLGGASSSASSVTLNGPAQADAVVSLASADPAVIVPASVTVPAGASSATFAVSTTGVSAATPVAVTATYGGVSKTATITVNPPALSTLTLSPTSTIGGTTTTNNTVTLSGIAPAAGMTVSLTSSNSAVVVPAAVTVPGGVKSVTFSISTAGVAASTPVTITANYGTVTKTATLTLTPAALSSVTLSPTSLTGGTSSTTSTVNLTGAAPSGGLVVTLTDSSANVTLPGTVTVPAGAKSATFTINTTTVSAKATATITASYNGVNKTATLTVTP